MNWPRATCATVFLIVSLSGPATLLACSCAGVTSAESAAHATHVFIGVPVSRRESPAGGQLFDGPRLIYRFKVHWTLKGTADIPEVSTNAESSSCGYPFELRAWYLVYATSDGEFLVTHQCNRTASLADAVPDLLAAVFWSERIHIRVIAISILSVLAGFAVRRRLRKNRRAFDVK